MLDNPNGLTVFCQIVDRCSVSSRVKFQGQETKDASVTRGVSRTQCSVGSWKDASVTREVSRTQCSVGSWKRSRTEKGC